MKLSVCSGNLQKAFGKDMFRVIKECGFDACDLNVASVWGMTDGAGYEYLAELGGYLLSLGQHSFL